MTLEAFVAIGVPLAISLPHVLPLHRASPQSAAAVWFFALALRALVAIGAATFVFVYLPQTNAFQAAADWCWGIVSHHLGLSGHPLAHAAAILPALAIGASLVWVVFGLTRAGVALRLLLARRSLGAGPMGSVIVEADEILIATTGVGRARIVVSEAALGAMDRHELKAGFAHELGHIRRRHRPVLLAAAALRGLARLLPGTVASERELVFSLERDADEYAVRATRDPLALASAICKASDGGLRSPTVAALAGQGRTTLRLDYLIGGARRGGELLERSTYLFAAILAAMTITLTATLPAWALASPTTTDPAAGEAEACQKR